VSWKTYLDNHRKVLAAMDFFTVPTLTFRLLYVLLVIHHDRRRALARECDGASQCGVGLPAAARGVPV
jgi:hypothetical protein